MQDFSHSKKIVAIIPAAGIGNRLKADLPKALAILESKTLLERTLSVFCQRKDLLEIIVLCPPDYQNEFKQILNSVHPQITLVVGDATRQQSVFCGLKDLSARYEDQENLLVVIHDAARCLVNNDIIDRVIEAAIANDAVTAAVPIFDTIKEVDADGRIERQVDRSRLSSIQTPQAFRFDIIWKAHQYFNGLGKHDFTDDTAMLEGKENVYIVSGARSNIKITSPEDLSIAKAFLQK